MVNYNDQQLNQIFSALSDSTRRAMLLRLTDEAMSVADHEAFKGAGKIRPTQQDNRRPSTSLQTGARTTRGCFRVGFVL